MLQTIWGMLKFVKKVYLVQVYVTTRPESLAIEVLQFGEGFQVYSTREKTAEYYNSDDELYST